MLVALWKYFGPRDGQTLMQFKDEAKALSESEKRELAVAAAIELGLTLKD